MAGGGCDVSDGNDASISLVSGARGGGWDRPVDGGCWARGADTAGRAVGMGGGGCSGGCESGREGQPFSGSTLWQCAMAFFCEKSERTNTLQVLYMLTLQKAYTVVVPAIIELTLLFCSDGNLNIRTFCHRAPYTVNWEIELLWTYVECGD